MSKKVQGSLRAAMQEAKRHALVKTSTTPASAPAAQTVSLDEISLPPWQPRRYFDPDAMTDMTTSVQKHGVLQPVLVRPAPAGGFELVAGERRFRAAKACALERLPVVVKDLTDDEAKQYALIENLQREDLNPIEETEAILGLLGVKLGETRPKVISLLHRMFNEQTGKTKTQTTLSSRDAQQVVEVFEGLGRLQWPSFVTTRLPLLNLPADVLEALRGGQVEYTKAREIARISNSKARHQLIAELVTENLPLAQVRARVKSHLPAAKQKARIDSLGSRASQIARDIRRLEKREDSTRLREVDRLLSKLEQLLHAAGEGSRSKQVAERQQSAPAIAN